MVGHIKEVRLTNLITLYKDPHWPCKCSQTRAKRAIEYLLTITVESLLAVDEGSVQPFTYIISKYLRNFGDADGFLPLRIPLHCLVGMEMVHILQANT